MASKDDLDDQIEIDEYEEITLEDVQVIELVLTHGLPCLSWDDVVSASSVCSVWNGVVNGPLFGLPGFLKLFKERHSSDEVSSQFSVTHILLLFPLFSSLLISIRMPSLTLSPSCGFINVALQVRKRRSSNLSFLFSRGRCFSVSSLSTSLRPLPRHIKTSVTCSQNSHSMTTISRICWLRFALCVMS